ncbi:junctional sarcoplasmic reticulum protein 1 [Trichechus inunguis]
MTTRALEELDGGLGSCQAGEDLATLADPCPGRAREDEAQVTPRLTDLSSQPHVSSSGPGVIVQIPPPPGGGDTLAKEGGFLQPTGRDSPAAEGSVDAKSKQMEKEPVVKVAPSPGKEKLKAGATPRSAPARKKAQAAPPPQPPPPPPCEELPWGDLSLNKCLVLVSLVALLGSAFQLCRDAVTGKVDVPAPAPEPWVPPSSVQKARDPPLPKHACGPPPPEPPAYQAEAEARPEAPGNREATKEDKEASKATGEVSVKAQVDRGPKEKASGQEWRKEERPRKERPRREKEEKPRREKEEKPRKEKVWKEKAWKEERPRADRELRGALPQRRDSEDPERSKRPTWASKRRGQTSSEEEKRPDRQKRRAGKGRD